MTPVIPASDRLIDLAVEWPLQYAGESAAIDPSLAPLVRDRLGQVEGYLSGTLAAIVWIGPTSGGQGQADPWHEVARLFAGVEAEFPGRILADPADLERFAAEPPDTMTWALVGLRGASELLRSADASDRLAGLIGRGVRAIRLSGLVDRPPSLGDDRPLSESERAAIALVCSAASPSRPLLIDLAGLPPTALGDAIRSIGEAGPGTGQVVPMLSMAAVVGGSVAGLPPEDFKRFRSLGGLIGLCPARAFHPDADRFGQAIDEAAGLLGGDLGGIAVGTGFLGIDAPIDGLDTVPGLLDWLPTRFDPEVARAIASGNAQAILGALEPVPSSEPPKESSRP